MKEIKIENFEEKGFIALISAVLVSAALLAAVLQNTNAISVIFDEANHKHYRFLAMQSALFCLDWTNLELVHDYFFEVETSFPVSYPISQCSIVSVGETAGFPAGSGYKTITVMGKSNGVTAIITAQVLLSDEKISLLSEKTFF